LRHSHRRHRHVGTIKCLQYVGQEIGMVLDAHRQSQQPRVDPGCTTRLGGHGGVLDRLDALLWAGPAAFAVLLAFA